MFELLKSDPKEIPKFVQLECAKDTSEFVIPYPAEKHKKEMRKEQIYYLSIYNNKLFSGFIILALESNGSIEFRRIVVASKGKGEGQTAIWEMEKYCATVLKCNRIWLDVFASNLRGIHIYKKLGYKQFKTSEFDGKQLFYFEKTL